MQKGNLLQLTKQGKIFLQLFLRFLKQNKCFYEYRKAFAEMYEIRKVNSLSKLTSCCNKLSPDIVDRTLYWAETAEGFNYWEDVNAQFKDLCYRLGY